MARRADDLRDDPAVIVTSEAVGSFDEWLAGLRRQEPVVLPVPAWKLLEEVRAESE